MSGHATPAELLDAVYYASTVITLGPDPDNPGRVVIHTFQSDDSPAALPPAVAVAKLRQLADALERGAA
ncbi:hypothetical protein [Nocardia amikacinitolerans]|uniref:hypothetical protein n=1 Tax=Nocardia amikacinitolerans TaxID=756689 RepID=UPI0020A361CB|nr:hypothetical protein [Nocardia amikacinitolerans]MCP2281079.1 hypothetical protein [Nocardia amikacinitolerans]